MSGGFQQDKCLFHVRSRRAPTPPHFAPDACLSQAMGQAGKISAFASEMKRFHHGTMLEKKAASR